MHEQGTVAPTQTYCVVEVDDNKDNPYHPEYAQFSFTVEQHDPIAPPDRIGPLMTEAQASIIAFALNAIESGATLYFGFGTNEILTAYDGPTEGVRAA
jgi:hypothetical protein